MSKKTFKVGDQVVLIADFMGPNDKLQYINYAAIEDNYCTVVELLPGSPETSVKVKWGVQDYWHSQDTFDASKLMHRKEFEQKYSKLETAYKEVEAQVKDKLKEAGKLIKESNKMAKKLGLESLNEMYDAIDPLYQAMDACGWRTSSFSC